jgi:hypothetical protein
VWIVLLFLLLGAGGYFGYRLTAEPRAETVPGPAPLPAETPSANLSQIHVRVIAFPREARIFIDGNPMPENPLDQMMPRDEAPHELRVEADGFEAQKRDISLARDLDLTVALDATNNEASEVPPAPATAPKVRPQVRGTKPQPTPRAQPQPAPAPATKTKAGCDPPWRLLPDGKKSYKRECF